MDDLLSFIEQTTHKPVSRIEKDYHNGYVCLKIDEAQQRQAADDIQSVEDALIELMRNARDAGASSIFIATQKIANTRFITIIDNGCGIPSNMHADVFKPRVTSRLKHARNDIWGYHGRGMALFSIAHQATSCSIVKSCEGAGTAIRADFDLSLLSEKKNQSIKPHLCTIKSSVDIEGGFGVASSTHNIAFCAAQAALSMSEHGRVYLGSPAEIIATLRSCQPALYGNAKKQEGRWIASDLINAKTPSALIDAAQCLGLTIAERTAYRLYNHEIAPLEDVLTQLRKQQEKKTNSQKAKNSPNDGRRSQLLSSKHEKAELKRKLRHVLEPSFDRLYIKMGDDMKISVENDSRLVISVPFQNED